MPLVAGVDAEFDARSGVVTSGNSVTSWAGVTGGWTITVPSGDSNPVNNLASLAGVNAISMNGVDQALHTTEAGYNRGNSITSQFVIRPAVQNTDFGYFIDGGALNDNAAMFKADNRINMRRGGTEFGEVPYTPDEWIVLTIIYDTSGNERIYIDDSLLFDSPESEIGAADGMYLGVRGGGGSGYGKFDVVHIVEYLGGALSDADVLSNVSFLQSEWGLGQVGPTYEVLVTKDSLSLAGKNTDMLHSPEVAVSKASFSITPKNIDAIQSFLMSVQKSSYSITGKDASMIGDYIIGVNKSSLSISTKNADLISNFLVEISKRSFSLSGKTVIMDYVEGADYVVQITKASLSMTGKEITFHADYDVQINKKSLSIDGKNLDSFVAFQVPVTKGSLSISPKEIDSSMQYKLLTSKKSYALNGKQVSMLHSALLETSKGVYTISGKNVDMLVVDTIPNPEVLRLVSEITNIIEADSPISQIKGNSEIPED